MTVLVVGEALIDVVERPDGTRDRYPGGSPFNVARGLARLDVRTEIATQLGRDGDGEILRSALAADHVLLSAEPASLPRTSTAWATVDADGAARYAFDTVWDPVSLPDPGRFEAIHVGSLGTFLQPGADAVVDLVVSADALGVPVSFDPNVRLAVDDDPIAWTSAFARVLDHARIVKLSDEDARQVTCADVVVAARELAEDGRLVAVTCGADDTLVAQGDRLVSVATPRVEVVDTIGAGDSFMAAMLAWFSMYRWPRPEELDESELHDLGSYAARAAALTVTRHGADPPRLREL